MAHSSPHGAHSHGAGAASHTGSGIHHEVTDIPLTGTTRTALATLVVLGIVMALVYMAWLFFVRQATKADPGVPPMAEKGYGSRLPPMPRVQSTPNSDLARYRAQQDSKLGSYGWVDRNTGVAHIPIERAMELVAGRASTIADPAAASAPSTPAAPTAAPATPTPATSTPAAPPAAPVKH